MKTVFIINPKAGKKNDVQALIDRIKNTTPEAETYITKAVGDGEKYVRRYCIEKGIARFIACGGDGTLNEVLNGAIEFEGTQVGVIPMGTGNDFCRNFKNDTDFYDIDRQVNGETVKCDVIRYKCGHNVRYCANMFNIGFDCNVAEMTAIMKQNPLISGPFAYFISIFAVLIKKKGANLKIEIDGDVVHEGPLLLTAISNGSYCGGGINSNPLADVQDGYINMNMICNVSRLRLLTLLPFYMKGTHIKHKQVEKFIANKRCKKVVLTPLFGEMSICVDGEIEKVGITEFEIVPEGFNMVVPTMVRESVK